MKENNKRNKFAAVLITALTVLFTIMVVTFDVQAIGPNGTSVGFASINKVFADLFAYNENFDKISDVIMYFSFLLVLAAVFMGVVELVKRKSLFKVDSEIIVYGVVLVILVILKVAFDKIALNYRPVLVPGETELEASFPSTHAMISTALFAGFCMVINPYLKDKKIKTTVNALIGILIALEVVCRVIAGVHWLTDIIGGLLFAFTLAVAMKAVIGIIDSKKKN